MGSEMCIRDRSTIMPFFRPFGSAGFRSTRLPTGNRGAAVIWGETRLPAQPILGRCVRIDTSARRPTIRWRGGEAPKTTSTHLMLPGGPSTDDLPARRRAALGLIQPVHSSGTSLYPNRGEGSPLPASFCARRRTCTKPKCTFRTQVWLLRQPLSAVSCVQRGEGSTLRCSARAPLPGGDARRDNEGYSQHPRRRITFALFVLRATRASTPPVRGRVLQRDPVGRKALKTPA